jgi:hypothetical protein
MMNSLKPLIKMKRNKPKIWPELTKNQNLKVRKANLSKMAVTRATSFMMRRVISSGIQRETMVRAVAAPLQMEVRKERRVRRKAYQRMRIQLSGMMQTCLMVKWPMKKELETA